MLRRFLLIPGSVSLVLALMSVLSLDPAYSQVYPPGFNDELVVGGFNNPTTFVFAPDGRILVGEQDGTIWVVDNEVVLPTPLTQLAADTNLEQGLLGMALHPAFPNPPELFVVYSIDVSGTPDFNRISKLTLSGNSVTNEAVLFQDIPLGKHYHVGGCLRIGLDEKLYVSMGDGGNKERSQDLGTLEGTLMRFNLDGTVPADNPWVGQPGVRPEIFQYGLRNPFRFSVQPGSGAIFIGDVGFEQWEEINVGAPQANFGWPQHEGMESSPDPATTEPLYTYDHSGGSASIAGNTFYTGNAFPTEYVGNYFFFDHSSGHLGRLVLDGNNALVSVDMPWIETLAVGWGNGPTELREGPDGALYYTTYDPGTLRRIYYDNASNTAPTAIAVATPTSGYAPLLVQFDGSGSHDVDGDGLSYAWDFGDGSATGHAVAPSHEYNIDGPYDVTLTVNDGHGKSHTAPSVRIIVGSLPPVVTILMPATGATFLSGQQVPFAGYATDPDDGAIPSSELHWQVYLHHLNHIHPVILDQPGSGGAFDADDHGEDLADIHYRVTLWTVDSSGVRGAASVDVFPDSLLLQEPAPQIISTPPATGTAGVPYGYPAQAASGVPTWSLAVSPAWLSVNGETGAVTGIPPGVGNHEVRLRAQNRSGLDEQAWTITVASGGTQTVQVIPLGATWRYHKGIQDPGSDWRQFDLDDSTWQVGSSGFGYGDNDDATLLADMKDSYSTVFTRHSFEVNNPSGVTGFALLYDYDDALAVYLNETLILSLNAPAVITYQSTANGSHEASGSLSRQDFTAPQELALLRQGSNCLAVVGMNSSVGSSDFTLKVGLELTGGLEESPTDVGAGLYGVSQPATPNPFAKSTALRFALSSPGTASLQIFDAGGRLVRTVTTPRLAVGTHSLAWDGRLRDGSRSPAGVYFYRLQGPGLNGNGKLIHMR